LKPQKKNTGGVRTTPGGRKSGSKQGHKHGAQQSKGESSGGDKTAVPDEEKAPITFRPKVGKLTLQKRRRGWGAHKPVC